MIFIIIGVFLLGVIVGIALTIYGFKRLLKG